MEERIIKKVSGKERAWSESIKDCSDPSPTTDKFFFLFIKGIDYGSLHSKTRQ